MNATELHPPISKVEITPADVDGGYLINSAGVVAIAKKGETEQSKRLYRLYLAEYRALEGQPLTHEKREAQALMSAMRRMGAVIQNVELGS